MCRGSKEGQGRKSYDESRDGFVAADVRVLYYFGVKERKTGELEKKGRKKIL